MVLQFTIDPVTGVYKPPITVFNGGKRRKTRRAKKGKNSRKASRKGRKTRRH